MSPRQLPAVQLFLLGAVASLMPLSADPARTAMTCGSELKATVLGCADVFTQGEWAPGRIDPKPHTPLDDQNNFRIPGFVVADGTLFAFAESYTRNCHPVR